MDVNANENRTGGGLFRTPLACGMLVGVLAAACDLLSYSYHRNFRWLTYLESATFTSAAGWLYYSILFATPALYRRSWRLLFPALMWSLPLSVVFIFLPILMRRFGLPLSFLLAYALPLLCRAALSGWISARLFGHAEAGAKFIAAALVVGVLRAGLYLALSIDAQRYAGVNGDVYVVVEAMGRLITSFMMGVALAWPVEALERSKGTQ